MTIKEWLESEGSYEEGLALFIAHSRRRALINYLSRKRDPLKLRYELEKMSRYAGARPAGSTTITIPPLPQKPHERLKVLRDGTVRVNDLPVILQGVYNEICGHYARMRHLHEKMKLVGSDAQRAAVRRELLDEDAKHRAAWAILDRWAADGTLPEAATETESHKEEPGTAPDDPPDAKAVNAARVGIGRDLMAIEKNPDEQKRAKLVARLQDHVNTIRAAGCNFGKSAAKLAELGLIPAE